MDNALEQYMFTLERLISLSTPNMPLVICKGRYGTEISIGKEMFTAYGVTIMPMELVDAYAYLKMALQVNKDKEPFKF